MTSEATYSSPLWWWPSRTRAFLEVPLQHPTIHSIELQQLESAGATGCIVELHMRSGELEIYAEPQLRLDEAWFRSDPPFAHFRLGALLATDFDHLRCNVLSGSIDAATRFLDRRGDWIDLEVTLENLSASDPFFIPAPIQQSPNNLRFLVANEFRMLPNRGSHVAVSIGGQAVEPEPFLLPDLRIAPYLSARAGADFLLVGLNPNHSEHRLPTADAPIDEMGVRMTFGLDRAGDALESVAAENEHAWIKAELNPALPPLEEIAAGGRLLSGEIECTSSVGKVCRCRWSAWAVEGRVAFELHGVDQDWSPGLRHPSRQALRWLRSRRRRGQQWTYRSGLSLADEGWRSTGTWTTVE